MQEKNNTNVQISKSKNGIMKRMKNYLLQNIWHQMMFFNIIFLFLPGVALGYVGKLGICSCTVHSVLYTAEHTRNTVSSRIEPSSLIPNAALLDVPDAAGRVLMAISLCLFGVRMLEFYAVSRLLGPKVLMVGRMVRICLFDFIQYWVYGLCLYSY